MVRLKNLWSPNWSSPPIEWGFQLDFPLWGDAIDLYKEKRKVMKSKQLDLTLDQVIWADDIMILSNFHNLHVNGNNWKHGGCIKGHWQMDLSQELGDPTHL